MVLIYCVELVCSLGFVGILCLCVYINLKEKENLINKRKMILLFVLELINYSFFARVFITDIVKLTFIPFFTGLMLVVLIFYNDKKHVIISWLVSMLIIEMISIILYPRFILVIINSLVSEENQWVIYYTIKLLFMYCCIISCFIYRKYVKNIEDALNGNKKIILVLTGFVVLVQIVRVLITKIETLNAISITTILMMMLSVTVLYLLIHSIKIEKRMKYTQRLNEQLECKNNDLRKIKHDYGAQISYLYGLYLLKRWDSIGEAINNIVENNQSVQSSVLLNQNKDSVIAKAVENLLQKGIHVVIEENADIEIIDINQEDIFYIIKKTGESVMFIAGNEGSIKIKTKINGNKFYMTFKSYIKNNNKERKSKIKENITDINNMKILLEDTIELVSRNDGKTYIKKNNDVLQVKIKFKL